jgi:hypothetical protein
MKDPFYQVDPCHQAIHCKNSPVNSPGAFIKCHLCRLAAGNEDFDQQFWVPLSSLKGADRKHLVLEMEKRAARKNRQQVKLQQRQSRDKLKRKLLSRAVRAEKTTETKIITATKNSGRSHQDGDHRLGDIALDTKLQTGRVYPVVDLCQLDKIRSQAANHNLAAGGLVLENKYGRKVVIFAWEDFPNVRAS